MSTDGPNLLTPLELRGVRLPNRIMMSPMSQHRADVDGRANDWHLVHYGSRAVGGVGIIMVEDCAVRSDGRLSNGALGLYADSQVEPLRRVVEFCREAGSVVGIQLGHAARKAFGKAKGFGPHPLVAPSPIPFESDWAVPIELDDAGIDALVEAFGEAAHRAVQAGFDIVEVHGAHGYLLHEFMSPLTNQRNDAYGGSWENRVRLTLRVVERVREVVPDRMLVFFRLSADDLEEGGLTVEDSIALTSLLKERGVDVIDVSAGGLKAAPVGSHTPNQPALAKRLREATGMPTIGVGGVTDAVKGNALLADGTCDIVAVGRALLEDPYWPRRI